MEKEIQPDLSRIHVAESFFMECVITNDDLAPVWPNQISGFNNLLVRVIPMVDFDRNRVAFNIKVQLSTLDAESKPLPVNGSFRIHLGFEVENLSELLAFDERFNLKLPSGLLTTSLIGVAYSTARGMLMSKLADTVLVGFSLPLRSARQLMDESQISVEEAQALPAIASKPKTSRKPKAKPTATKE